MPDGKRPTEVMVFFLVLIVGFVGRSEAQILNPQFDFTTIEVPKGVRGFAVGDGAAWLYTHKELIKIDRSNHLTYTPIEQIKGFSDFDYGGLAIGAGSAWIFGKAHGIAGLHRIDPTTGRCLTAIALKPESGDTSLTYAEGAVWVLNEFHGSLSRVDSATDQVTNTIELGKGHWQPISVGGGALWVIASESGVVKRVDPQTAKVVEEFSAGPAQHQGIISEAFLTGGHYSISAGEGTLWLANVRDADNLKHTLFRLDLRTHERVSIVPIRSLFGAPVFYRGYAWVRTGGYNRDNRNDKAGYYITAVDPKSNEIAGEFVLRPIHKNDLGDMLPIALSDEDSLWIYSGLLLGRIRQK